jgi:hypothetical protein
MAITFVGSAVANATNGGDPSIDLTTISGLAEDDVVVVAYVIGDNDNTDFDMAVVSPSGYAELADLFADDTRDCNLGVFWKRQGATVDTTLVLDGQGGTDAAVAAVAMAFRGVDLTTAIDTTTTTATGTSTWLADPPAINHTNDADGVAVIAIGGAGHTRGDVGGTLPTGYTTNAATEGADDQTDAFVAMGYNLSPADPENPGIITPTGADNAGFSWAAATVALRAEPSNDRTASGASVLSIPTTSGTATAPFQASGTSTLPSLTSTGSVTVTNPAAAVPRWRMQPQNQSRRRTSTW